MRVRLKSSVLSVDLIIKDRTTDFHESSALTSNTARLSASVSPFTPGRELFVKQKRACHVEGPGKGAWIVRAADEVADHEAVAACSARAHLEPQHALLRDGGLASAQVHVEVRDPRNADVLLRIPPVEHQRLGVRVRRSLSVCAACARALAHEPCPAHLATPTLQVAEMRPCAVPTGGHVHAQSHKAANTTRAKARLAAANH